MRHKPTSEPEFHTILAVMYRYGISRSSVYSWIATGRLPKPVKVGARAVRFRASDLAAFEAQFEPAAPAAGPAKSA